MWFYFFLNTLRSKQNGRHFPCDIFNCIFLNENVRISNKISLKFVPKDQINNIAGSDNGLAPTRRQAVTWTNDGLVYWRIYASLGQWVKCVGFKHTSSIRIVKPPRPLLMPQDPTDEKSTLVQVMAWCHQTPCYHMKQCRSRSMTPHGVTKPPYVKNRNVDLYIFFNIGIWVIKNVAVRKSCTSQTDTILLFGAAYKSWSSWVWNVTCF